jgi:hypothetical protein
MSRPAKAELPSCLSCKFALWAHTQNGRPHPSGDGHCKWLLPDLPIPSAFYWGTYSGRQAMLSGGYISRREPKTNCPTWEKADE